ncbi:MAG: hypothetical protein AAFU85_34385, partial [Planctomycetota bacterium]
DPLLKNGKRIMPIFRSPKPSSCVQCHLSSVDIRDYILPSHTETFHALREEGLIDVEHPEDSKILRLIQRGEEDSDAMARRIHEKTRRAEFEAFSAWIKACCKDKKLVESSTDAIKPVGPGRPVEVIRHTRKSRLLESFEEKIWSQRMRCFPCHTPGDIDPKNPKHKMATKRHREFVKQYGQKMNLFRESPEATLSHLSTSSRKKRADRFPLINLEEPANSLLVLKPTAKVPPKKDDGTFAKPSSTDPVTHMGGLKMHLHDHSYKLFLAWLEDYAAAADGAYRSIEDLPETEWQPTQRILRMKDVPKDWKVGSVVQLFVYNRMQDGWADEPLAFTQGTITPRGFVNGALLLFPTEPQSTPQTLTPGEYLIRVYVDRSDLVSRSPAAMLEEENAVGEVVLQAQWKVGFPKAQVFSATQLSQSE